MQEFTDLESGNIVPALVATGIWLAVGAALDVYLVATGKKYLITDVLRTKVGKLFLAILGLHVVDVLGRADPFSATAKVIRTRRGTVVLVPVNQSLSDVTTSN